MGALSAIPALSESRRLRLLGFFLMYVSQGVPFGLVQVAIPAWLVANGASAGQVGFFIGTAMLPWSLKLVNGLVIERFCYSPMGRTRAWIIGSQMMMMAALLVTAIIAPGPDEITLLAGLAFAFNLCGAVNDVAVDGMAIDILPEAEREKVNGFMFGGQVIGISGTAIMAGAALVVGGVALTAALAAAVVAVLTIIVTVLRERPGERLLPWTAGTASAECLARSHTKFLPILGKVLRGFVQWRTALFLAGFGVMQSSAGMVDVVGPVFSVSELGWSSEAFTNFTSISSFIVALVVMVVIGPLCRRFGNRVLIVAFASMMLLPNLAAYLAPSGAFGTLAMQAYISLFWGGLQGVVVLGIAWSMNLTNPLVAASQFSLFMAIPNLVRSLGAGVHGQIVDNYGYDAAFLVAALSVGLGTILCLLAGYGRLETIRTPRSTAKLSDPAAMPGVPSGLATT
ncbi:MFS transporter [Erythrobacter sp. R86502]|uniref:MFS transporter n=1 Tax=Erythrobacter sp. R86502 TaxID=3093846 RepID=UPI0036D2A07A